MADGTPRVFRTMEDFGSGMPLYVTDEEGRVRKRRVLSPDTVGYELLEYDPEEGAVISNVNYPIPAVYLLKNGPLTEVLGIEDKRPATVEDLRCWG